MCVVLCVAAAFASAAAAASAASAACLCARQTVSILGVVKGMDPGRHGLIFAGIMLLPLLVTAIMQLRWTNGESIDERLGRLANVNAFMLVGMDIALMVVMLEKQRQQHTHSSSSVARSDERGEENPRGAGTDR